MLFAFTTLMKNKACTFECLLICLQLKKINSTSITIIIIFIGFRNLPQERNRYEKELYFYFTLVSLNE